MRLARCRSVALSGVRGTVVDIEVHIGGMPGFTIVGLPDASLHEARDRVRAAVLSSAESWPLQRITVSLSPAVLPKRGSHFDLGIATAIVAAAEAEPTRIPADMVLLGELALDGRLRPVPGVLPASLAAVAAGASHVVVPEGNAGEAGLVPGLSVLGARSLRQVLAILRDEPVPDEPADPLACCRGSGIERGSARPGRRRGPGPAKHVLEVAAAGHHHLMLTGPPGAGKTMLARRLPGLLPDLTTEESLDVTAIHSVAGIIAPDRPLVTRPPFSDPHHTATVVSVVGGGGRSLRPGAASLAHLGVLFLDEAPRIRPAGARRTPPAARTWRDRRLSCSGDRGVPGPLSSCAGGQPMQVREPRHPRPHVRVQPGRCAPVRTADLRSGAGPDRPALHGRATDGGEPGWRRCRRRTEQDRRGSGSGST